MPKEGDQSASRMDKEHLPGEGYFLRTREESPDPKGAEEVPESPESKQARTEGSWQQEFSGGFLNEAKGMRVGLGQTTWLLRRTPGAEAMKSCQSIIQMGRTWFGTC